MKRDGAQIIRERLSREHGAVIKNWGGKLPIALVYPNSYFIGMSNLGIQAIYKLLNNYTDCVCERVFVESEGVPLSMESMLPLTDFAVIAFSISYELDYFNLPRILKAAGIPLYSKDRNATHPLLIAGGPCVTANGLPLAPFFDCLCIGEAEVILPFMLPVLREGVSENRTEFLKQLAKLPGIHVPGYSKQPAVRQWVKNMDASPVHSIVLTRDTELGGMYLIEVERGCNWGCKFCLVSNCFKPMRFHSVESLLAQGKEGLKYRKKLGLLGPAVTDHPHIEEIVTKLSGMGAEISVSSLRIKPLVISVLTDVIEGGARTMALAPEAGSQRIRDFIGKRIDEEDILEAVEKVALQAISQIKLYFMIGLPSETDDDILEIVRLVKKCRERMEMHRPSSRITLTISAFIPKALTPFQREGMAPLVTLNRRLALLKNKLSQKGFSVKNESIEWAEIQAVLSRGDEKLSPVIAGMESISLAQWHRAVKQSGIDTEYYAHQKWDQLQKLSWETIQS